MPDDRFLHKRAGHSERVTFLSDFEYRVWTCYLLTADDFGVMRFEAVTVQADHDALYQRPAKNVQRALERLREVELVATFEHQRRRYCCQLNWQDYQKVDYPRGTVHPCPPPELLDRCTEPTQRLFLLHPGGKGRRPKGGSNGGSSALPFGERSENVQEMFGDGSGTTRARDRAKALALAQANGTGEGNGSGFAEHAQCRPPCIRVCVHRKLHAVLRERHGGPDPDAALDAFYADVRAHLDPNQPIGDRAWPFWEGQFAAKFGTQRLAIVSKTSANVAAGARWLAGGAR